MPSVCSETVCSETSARRHRAHAVMPVPGMTADKCWKSGVFPNAVFQGYTSPFGRRRGPDGEPEAHTGLDIAAPLGSPVLSWWMGRVVETIDHGSCGIGVVIASGGYEHIYCHLKSQRLRPGQLVRGGQVIGQVGMTGWTTGPPSSLGHPLSGPLARPGHDHQSHDPQPSSQQCPQCNRPLMFRVQSATLPL